MVKPLMIGSWTLLVAIISFTAGRMAAPVYGLGAGEAGESAGAQVVIQPGLAQPRNAEVVATAGHVFNPAPAGHVARPEGSGGNNYAADYQTLQALVVLAATNPALAMEKAQQFKGAIKARAESAILEVWGGIDPYGAWNWVASFQPENGQQFINLLEVIGRSQPQTAASYAEKYLASHHELRKDIYQATLTGITQAGDYRLATQLLESLALEPEVKAELTRLVISNWAAYEPRAAAQWLASQPEAAGTAALEQLGNIWADADPQGAVSFAASESGQARENLLLPSFKKWLGRDPAAATSWLSAQRDKAMDPLLGEVATMPELVNDHVQNALTWAGKIQAPELRISTLTSILSALKQKDPQSAASYLQQVDYLTEAERSRLYEDLAFEIRDQ